MFQLKEVKWEWDKYDRFEGILVARFETNAKIAGEGLFCRHMEETANVSLDIVIQTAHHSSPNPQGCAKDVCAEERAVFKTHCQNYLRGYIHHRIRSVADRIMSEPLDLTLRIFDPGYVEITGDFEPIHHFGSKDEVIRFLSLYGYGLETLASLEEEYETNKEDILLDTRLTDAIKFMGPKAEETLQLAKDMSNTSKEIIINLRRMIAFYL